MKHSHSTNNYVLIVDDIEVNLKLISEVLKKNGIGVYTAISGEQAIRITHEKLPDLILLDIAMPEMDGFTVCKRLKEDPETENIPIIFLTARNDTEDIVKGLDLGAVDYLTKPYKPQELLSRVVTHLDLKRSKDKINEQKETLKQNHEQLTKSLYYARHIQEKLLPGKKLFEKHLSNYFIFQQPKNIVSGDFYWLAYQDDLLFLAVADATGHGMPGALMAMIGNTLLNEIIIKNRIYEPSQILHKLSHEVKEALSREDEPIPIDNEGMDISICIIDKKQKKVMVSSANQDIYYIQDNTLHTIEGQIISIGGSQLKNGELDFVTHSIDTNKSTYFYLLTDGFQDQFGGPSDEKFQTKAMKKLLLDNYHLPSEDQRRIFETHFLEWKKSTEQTDDILVLGFEV